MVLCADERDGFESMIPSCAMLSPRSFFARRWDNNNDGGKGIFDERGDVLSDDDEAVVYNMDCNKSEWGKRARIQDDDFDLKDGTKDDANRHEQGGGEAVGRVSPPARGRDGMVMSPYSATTPSSAVVQSISKCFSGDCVDGFDENEVKALIPHEKSVLDRSDMMSDDDCDDDGECSLVDDRNIGQSIASPTASSKGGESDTAFSPKSKVGSNRSGTLDDNEDTVDDDNDDDDDDEEDSSLLSEERLSLLHKAKTRRPKKPLQPGAPKVHVVDIPDDESEASIMVLMRYIGCTPRGYDGGSDKKGGNGFGDGGNGKDGLPSGKEFVFDSDDNDVYDDHSTLSGGTFLSNEEGVELMIEDFVIPAPPVGRAVVTQEEESIDDDEEGSKSKKSIKQQLSTSFSSLKSRMCKPQLNVDTDSIKSASNTSRKSKRKVKSTLSSTLPQKSLSKSKIDQESAQSDTKSPCSQKRIMVTSLLSTTDKISSSRSKPKLKVETGCSDASPSISDAEGQGKADAAIATMPNEESIRKLDRPTSPSLIDLSGNSISSSKGGRASSPASDIIQSFLSSPKGGTWDKESLVSSLSASILPSLPFSKKTEAAAAALIDVNARVDIVGGDDASAFSPKQDEPKGKSKAQSPSPGTESPRDIHNRCQQLPINEGPVDAPPPHPTLSASNIMSSSDDLLQYMNNLSLSSASTSVGAPEMISSNVSPRAVPLMSMGRSEKENSRTVGNDASGIGSDGPSPAASMSFSSSHSTEMMEEPSSSFDKNDQNKMLNTLQGSRGKEFGNNKNQISLITKPPVVPQNTCRDDDETEARAATAVAASFNDTQLPLSPTKKSVQEVHDLLSNTRAWLAKHNESRRMRNPLHRIEKPISSNNSIGSSGSHGTPRRTVMSNIRTKTVQQPNSLSIQDEQSHLSSVQFKERRKAGNGVQNSIRPASSSLSPSLDQLRSKMSLESPKSNKSILEELAELRSKQQQSKSSTLSSNIAKSSNINLDATEEDVDGNRNFSKNLDLSSGTLLHLMNRTKVGLNADS